MLSEDTLVTFSENDMTVIRHEFGDFLKVYTPLVFHVFIVVAVLVYLVNFMAMI